MPPALMLIGPGVGHTSRSLPVDGGRQSEEDEERDYTCSLKFSHRCLAAVGRIRPASIFPDSLMPVSSPRCSGGSTAAWSCGAASRCRIGSLGPGRPTSWTLRPLLIDLLQRLHAEGVCHRDLHWENVVIVGRAPFVIDLEYACDVDPAGPCYDLTGPFAGVPLLPAHAQFEGILGTQGMWWDAAWDRARAGEAGMGFGVVADEVRNLAKQNAQAAKETASMIEAAVAQSQLGVEVNGRVTSRIAEVVQSSEWRSRQPSSILWKRPARSMPWSARSPEASKEQNSGLEQINSAINLMNQVTQANAAGSEQTASASEELTAQSIELRSGREMSWSSW